MAFVVSAVDVATADGFVYMARLLLSPVEGRVARACRGSLLGKAPATTLLGCLTQGAYDADYPASGGYVLHIYHFHQPWTHRGFGGWYMSAANVSEMLFLDALDLWRAGRLPEATYELGRATHLLVDPWVPQHAALTASCGHGPYEEFLNEDGRWRDYAPGSGGHYEWHKAFYPPGGGPPHTPNSLRPYDWVDLAAHESYPWFVKATDTCAHPDGADKFPEAAAVLVPRAIRYLAGYLNYFFTLAGVAEPPEEVTTGEEGSA